VDNGGVKDIDTRGGTQNADGALEQLIEEAYGPNVEAFLETPRASLGDMAPREALAAGPHEAVRAIVVDSLLGHWS
jgi:hypothetical protein